MHHTGSEVQNVEHWPAGDSRVLALCFAVDRAPVDFEQRGHQSSVLLSVF